MTLVPKYYLDVVQCTEACPLVQNCNVDQTLPRRFLPRGTTSRATPGGVRLMIIAANPGRPQAQEDQVYNHKSAQKLASSAWAFTEATLEGRTGFSPTLDQLLKEAAYLLDCCPMDVLDQCVVTNHVRCSTLKAYSSYSRSLRKGPSSRCIRKHFLVELDYWKPQKLAVFSATAREALEAAGIHFDGYIPHPTALGCVDNQLTIVIPDVRRA